VSYVWFIGWVLFTFGVFILEARAKWKNWKGYGLAMACVRVVATVVFAMVWPVFCRVLWPALFIQWCRSILKKERELDDDD